MPKKVSGLILTERQLDDAPTDAELQQEDQIRRRQERSRRDDEFSATNQDPWIS